MQFSDIFMITSSPLVSSIIWVIVVPVVLYLARTPAHRAIQAFSRVMHNAMRLSANSVLIAEKKLMERNKEVLLAAGRIDSGRIIEREFDRVDATVRKDLAEYPSLQRKLSEEIEQIDEDYSQSTEVPPQPPGWVKAVEAVANIEVNKGDPTIGNILEDIYESLKKASANALKEYRHSSHERHKSLNRMMPHWRKLSSTLTQVDKNVNSLLERSKVIDRHMEDYEQILKQTDRATRMLSSSSLTQFFISAFVLAIAVGGAMINFNLIALPMSEMVGAKSQILGYPTSEVAALVIILVEVSLGLFMMESMRITRLFPVIGALNDKMRIRMLWITFGFLFALASVESGLAYMREILAQQNYEVTASLIASEGTVVIDTSMRWITTAAQMGMGFILPFALVFVAIPLESFIHSLRTVLGVLGVATLRLGFLSLRFIGDASRFLGRGFIHVYDLVIFAPLWVEKVILDKKHASKSGTDYDSGSIST